MNKMHEFDDILSLVHYYLQNIVSRSSSNRMGSRKTSSYLISNVSSLYYFECRVAILYFTNLHDIILIKFMIK